MTPLLTSLFAAYRTGAEALETALSEVPSNQAGSVAAEARAHALAALDERDGDAAFGAFAIAASVLLRNGQRGDAFKNMLDGHQLLFMAAETEAAYRSVYLPLHAILDGGAEGIPDGLRFRGMVFLADCAYWASEVAEDDATRREWLGKALADLRSAAPGVHDPGEAASAARFALVLVSAQASVAQRGWSGEAWAKTGLRNLAQTAAALAGAALPYPDPSKAAQIAQVLRTIAAPSPLTGRKTP